MTRRCLSLPLRVAATVCSLCLITSLSWAQNENETVGFKPNHAFESGGFGENLDMLNGGLNLTVPIGQRYQPNSRLGYQLSLNYNSKVWDTNDHQGLASPHEKVVARNEGPFGIGFSLHFGRIFNDPQKLTDFVDEAQNNPSHTVSWVWVSPDGSQHEFFFDSSEWTSYPYPEGVAAGPVFTLRRTNDLSYTLISGPDDKYCYGAGETGCFRVHTPDGLVYTLVKPVDLDCKIRLANGI
jgi:hypothetical protein